MATPRRLVPALLLGLVLLASCSQPGSAPAGVAPVSASASPSVPVATTAAAASPSPSVAPATAAPVAQSWTMPDLVGANLQDAQDAIQRLTSYGIAITYSHDESGEDRSQVIDSNWKVCTQNVAPGETINPATRIEFGAVKLDERC